MKKSSVKIMHYTIVEMMMVIAVFMIILSMAMVAWLNSGNQANLKNAARLVSAQLNLAKAKAVTNREIVRVEFTNAHNTTKVEILYGESGTEKPHDTEPFYLPAGIFFVADKGENNGVPVSYADGDSSARITPAAVFFTTSGNLKADSGNKRFYLMEENPKGKAQSGQNYYVIAVNQFTGRINTTLETVAD
ncbi:MAG: hypothetical protein J6Q81_01800 [Lentisphaeria bacterium]|nr:hypothetical protein [Lentisphaeria bacterium]